MTVILHSLAQLVFYSIYNGNVNDVLCLLLVMASYYDIWSTPHDIYKFQCTQEVRTYNFYLLEP